MKNTGSVVDELGFEVRGAAGAWGTASPASVRLMPGAEGSAEVVFRPPREASVPAGIHPFELRIDSRARPDASIAMTGTVSVGSYDDLSIELSPRRVRAATAASFRLAVRNQGNRGLRVTPTATEPEGRLAIGMEPAAVDVPAGGSATVEVVVRAPRRMSGGETTTEIDIAGSSSGDGRAGPPISGRVTFVQQPDRTPLLLGLLLLAVSIGVIVALVASGLLGGGGGGDGETQEPGTEEPFTDEPVTDEPTPVAINCDGELETQAFVGLSADRPEIRASDPNCLLRVILFLGETGTGFATMTLDGSTILEIDIENFDSIGDEGAGSGERVVELRQPVRAGQTVGLDLSGCSGCGSLTATMEIAPPASQP